MIKCREKNYYPDSSLIGTEKRLHRPPNYRPKNCRYNVVIAYDRSRHSPGHH